MEKNNLNIIAKFRVGSHLYGTNNINSDEDYAGIFLEPIDYLLSPFKSIEEVDFSIKDKLENGKNSKEAIDEKYYSFKKFIKLAYNCNPNILEMLFINKENLIQSSPIYELITSNKELFLSDTIFKKFFGYATAQERKMYTTSENYLRLIKFYEIIKDKDKKLTLLDIEDEIKNNNFYIFKKKLENDRVDFYLKVNESITFPLNITIKKVLDSVEEIINLQSYRKDFILSKGYDFKFGSHVVRILEECFELVTTKNLIFPLQDSELIKRIKEGEMDIENLKRIIHNQKQRLSHLENNHDLPKHFKNLKLIENLSIDILYESIYNGRKKI